MWQILATLVFGVGLPVCSTAQPAATTSSIGGAEVPSARQRGLKLVLGDAGFNRLTVEQRENLLSGRTMCATSYLAKSEQPNRTARRSRVASYADLPTVGDHLQNKKYRLVLIFIATAGHDSARPVLIRNSFLPGRVPATTSSTPNWTQSDTLNYDTYVKDAIEYFFEKNSYGALDVDVVIPYPPNSSSPIWVSPADTGKAVVDSVLRRIETAYPDSLFYDVSTEQPPSPYTYQRVGYLFTDSFATGWLSAEDNDPWASEAIRDSIWDGATFAGAAWAGTGNPLWPDVHSETFAWQIIHEMLHHITYANASHPSFADRGVREFGTRTWGFDIMDHGGKACATNGHYGAHALAPIDKYLLGFIEENWLRTITTNTTDVRLSPNHVSPPSGGRLLARIPLSSGTSGTESFVVSNHQGIDIDEVYNPGMGDSLNNGLHIWHIGDGFELGFQSNRADVEVAWTIAPGDTFFHPEGQSHNPSSWAVSQYLPTEYSDNFDWIDGVLYDSPLYPSMGGKGLYILNQAYGGWSAGEPGRGKSTAFCNHNSDSGTLRWEHLYDRNIITPTINDFFRPGNAFTPYSRPNTDKYHRYAVTSYADSMVCTQGEPQEDRPRDGSIVLPAGGAPFVSSQLRDVNDGLTRVGIVNIRQETNGDMLFDVYFNFWEGEFNDARNFGYLKRYDDGTECESGSVCWRNVWESMTLAGVAHDTVVVGPNGFLVNTGRKITVKTGTTMKVLGPITVEGTLAVESGVVWETIAADITVAEGGRLEIGSGATLKFASGKKLKVKGNLIANNATFTRSGTSGTWGGIEADATGAKLELTGCSIRYGTYGIRGTTNAKTDTLILRQCTFDANGTGLSFVGNTSAGNRSMISDSGSTYINNTGDAVYVEAATPTSSIKSATIEYNEGWGIYLFNNAMSVGGYGTGSNIRRNKGGIRLNIHTGTIWRNTVHHNVTSVATTYPGILCTSGITIKKNNVHTNGVRNLSFDGDDTAQLDTNWVYTDSTIASGDAEIFANNYFDLVLRQNNIHTSDYNDYGEPTGTLPWAIRNDGNELEINAPYNWWGTASPTFSAIIVDVTNANTSYALSLPSNADWSLKPTRQSVDEVADSEVAWENARTLEIVGDDARALAGYQGFVDDFPAADGVPSAVRRIFALMTRSGASKSEMEDYFNGLAQERVSAKVLLAAQEMRRQTMVWFGEYDDAVAAYRAVAESDGPAARRQIAWFRIAYIAKTLGDNTLLRDAISGVLAGGQESNLAQIVLAEFGEQVTKPTNETATADLPALTAVPNPFNPTTSITYRVTAQGNVSVQVYNALGQRVRELVNTTAQPGVYTVVWDGKDSAARPVGSGVYLVRLITPAAVVTERVTLLR